MKRYVVSIIWIKQDSYNNVDIINSLSVNIDASHTGEAFEIAYERGKKLNPNHMMFSKAILEQVNQS